MEAGEFHRCSLTPWSESSPRVALPPAVVGFPPFLSFDLPRWALRAVALILSCAHETARRQDCLGAVRRTHCLFTLRDVPRLMPRANPYNLPPGSRFCNKSVNGNRMQIGRKQWQPLTARNGWQPDADWMQPLMATWTHAEFFDESSVALAKAINRVGR